MSDRSASVSGPIPGAFFLGSPQSYGLAALGYSNEEHLLDSDSEGPAVSH